MRIKRNKYAHNFKIKNKKRSRPLQKKPLRISKTRVIDQVPIITRPTRKIIRHSNKVIISTGHITIISCLLILAIILTAHIILGIIFKNLLFLILIGNIAALVNIKSLYKNTSREITKEKHDINKMPIYISLVLGISSIIMGLLQLYLLPQPTLIFCLITFMLLSIASANIFFAFQLEESINHELENITEKNKQETKEEEIQSEKTNTTEEEELEKKDETEKIDEPNNNITKSSATQPIATENTIQQYV